jgi:hypothetical protein
MTLSLYAATIPSFQQILGSVATLLDKAEEFCAEQGLEHADIIQARLIDDMLPFAYQVKSTVEHSVGAIAGVRAGNFSPAMDPPPSDFATLKAKVAGGRAALDAMTPDEINALAGQDMQFSMNDFRIPFTAEGFLLSFSLPNFYFHATTAYDILRGRGVKIGKMNFLGTMQVRG